MGCNFTSLLYFAMAWSYSFHDFYCVPSPFFGRHFGNVCPITDFTELPVGTYLPTFKTNLSIYKTSPTVFITLCASGVKAHLSVEK